MSSEVVASLERLWLDLWNERAMDEMLTLLDPAYVERDHCRMQMSGPSREDWRKQMEGWWALVPDVRCMAMSVIAAGPQTVAYTLRFEGTDSISGGRMEIVVHIANRFEGGRIREADLFEDAADAAECLDRHKSDARQGAFSSD